MISIDDICCELQRIDGQASEQVYEIQRIGELVQETMGRVQSDFSDQQVGKMLLNTLSLIKVSCDNAASSIGQVNAAAHDAISKLKR